MSITRRTFAQRLAALATLGSAAGAGAQSTEMVFRQPKLIVEVLSSTTQAFDRGLKFAAYRQIDALQEYVLVDPDTRRVEVFRRNERGLFKLHDQTGAEALYLASIDLRLSMAEVFDGVEDAAATPAIPAPAAG